MSDFLVVDVIHYLVVCADTEEEVEDSEPALLSLPCFAKIEPYQIDNNLVIDGRFSSFIPR